MLIPSGKELRGLLIFHIAKEIEVPPGIVWKFVSSTKAGFDMSELP